MAAGVSALALALTGSPAGAQQAASASSDSQVFVADEIVVQARKRDEVLTKIPETISVLTSAQIVKAGVKGLDDIGRLTPNVRLNRKQDNEPNVVIRGVGSFGNTQGVGFYIDDVQNFTDQTAAVEDVERIDILKGPQGTLYGGSNVGGAIKYVMVKPGNELSMQAKAEYGTFDTTNLFGALNVPLTDTLAVRVSSYYNRTDGYVRNVFLDRQSDAMKEWGIRSAVRWTPVEALTVDLSYRHNELNTGGNVFVVFPGQDYLREVSYNAQGFSKRVVDGGILTAKYDMDFADLTSVTSYTRRKASFQTDSDYSPADFLLTSTPSPSQTKVFTQELRLTSSGYGPFTWLVGAYYAQIDDASTLSHTNLRFGVDTPQEIIDATGLPFVPFEFPLYNVSSKFRQKALFGTVGYRTGPFKIEAGMRVGRSEFRQTFLDAGITAKSNGTKLLPKLTLSYDVDNNTIVYGNIGVGSEPGRVNITSPLPYKAEQATSVELGIKGTTLDRKLSFDLVAFYIDYKDRQQIGRAHV
jgi:outer membrane receptor protein involved in Fe transport